MNDYPDRWAAVWARRLERSADNELCRQSFRRNMGNPTTLPALQDGLPPELLAFALKAANAADSTEMRQLADRLKEWIRWRRQAADA